MTRTDVVVVGAGPAGAVAAKTLARGGASVTLVERHSLPRDKTCGDGLIPDAIELLRSLGVWSEVRAAGHLAGTVRVFAPDAGWVDLAGEFCTIRRRELDHILVSKAVEAGVLLRDGTRVIGTEISARGAELDTVGPAGNERMRARLVVLACGANARLLDRFGVLERRGPSAFAMRTYWELPADVDERRLRVWFERPILPGYGWLFPLGNRRFNVGVGIAVARGRRRRNLRTVWQRFLDGCQGVGELLQRGRCLAPFTGAPLRTALAGTRPSADRLLICGEAIGATYSLTGEGIGKAMQTARLAAEIGLEALGSDRLDAAGLSRYDQLLEVSFRERFRHYAAAQRWLGWPSVCNYLVRRARASRRVRSILEDVIAERRQPTEVLSMRGLLRALVLP